MMKKIYKESQLLEVNNIPSEVIESIKVTIDILSKYVKETDERLANKFKQDIKSYAKENSIGTIKNQFTCI